MKIVDVEIKKAILGRGELPMPNVEYCGGWRDYENMGIACVCTYDLNTRLSRCFHPDEPGQLQELQAELANVPTGGFNTRGFDINLLEANGVKIEIPTHFDALRAIWKTLGLDPDNYNHKTHGGWSLGNIMHHTFGVGKSGNGALAPVWWQQGKKARVTDYCLRDVWLEGMLIEGIRRGKPIRKDNSGAGLVVSMVQ